ncbi:glutamate--tRNA ligase [Sinimarinibacterium sp. CAU 1509]|uniref:glutamate--tRNA ligase n=1 Tax=Sinimarinibacterium sp. CAU 1509 TaxID=2562283 RepID=UPI0010AD9040|nr:glutamate--tRNA ligase [Sinimarinibacterium sp. CAU 1509]TJY56606.1 glutamate--tRNA ligase [Sinimarinibacterium sp. CAU 1509]
MTASSSITTRFAPSPTGFLHIGGARTALFSYLYAKRHGGKFLLRIEDTDIERSTQEAVDAIFEGMDWLGLKSDFEPIYQTQRFDRYKTVIAQMLEAGTAYHCYCTRDELDQMRNEQMARKEKPRYDGRWRPEPGKTLPPPPDGVPPVVRFRNPAEGQVVIDDLIKGQIVFDNRELDDLIIARADGTPTYNFCVVIDDWDMGITQVIRGDDHVNNTPRQINIFKALGAPTPQYAHVSMILGSDGSKLSKRHGALGVMEYRAMGFLPEAMLNYLVRLGWSHGDQELFTREEMINLFDFRNVSSSASRFDMEKAYWVNHQYLKTADVAVVAPEFEWHLRRMGLDLANGPRIEDVILAQRERCRTLLEMAEKSHFLYDELSGYNEKDAAKHLTADAAEILDALVEALSSLLEWTPEAVHQAVHGVAEARQLGLGKVAQPIRVAVVGMAVSPPIDQTLVLLGRTRTLERLTAAAAYIRNRS